MIFIHSLQKVAVPGAFTPGCSKSHLPSFITAQDELKDKGVDMIICIATNDAYVMEVIYALGFKFSDSPNVIFFLSDVACVYSNYCGKITR